MPLSISLCGYAHVGDLHQLDRSAVLQEGCSDLDFSGYSDGVTRFSRLTASAKHAGVSSCVSTDMSARIFSSVMPAGAKQHPAAPMR